MKRKVLINRGALLFAVAAIAVLVYLIIFAVYRGIQKDDIKALIDSYYTVSDAFKVSDEGDTAVNDAALQKKLDDMREKVSALYIDDERAYINVVTALSEIITENSHKSVYTAYKTSVGKIEYEFKSTKRVSLAVKIGVESAGSVREYNEFTVNFSLEKTSDGWRLTYTDSENTVSNNNGYLPEDYKFVVGSMNRREVV